jgi:hypothetical protein
MASNFNRYKNDLDKLIKDGDLLRFSIQYYCDKKGFEKEVTTKFGAEEAMRYLRELPDFASEYQTWYSEAKALIKQVLPDRLEDFVRHYEKPKNRKNITYETYRIDDCLQGLTVNRGDGNQLVGLNGAIPHFQQQLAILQSVKPRFESALFDIVQLVQGDVFDSELEAAKELLKHRFTRAAGALAGVVLERHLGQVCESHSIKATKKNPSISDLNDALKGASILEVSQWRFVQHLADIRNSCDHSKSKEPTIEQVQDLIDGTLKITKTVF